MKTIYFSILPLAAAGFSIALQSCQAPPQSCDLSAADRDSLVKAHNAATAPVQQNPGTADWAKFVDAHYSADAILMAPGGDAVQGREAIVSAMSTMTGLTKFDTKDLEVEGSGNLAYIRGTYEMSMQINDSVSVDDKGKYIEIWRKDEAGQWRCTRDIYNSSLAPDANAAEPAEAATEESAAAADAATATQQ